MAARATKAGKQLFVHGLTGGIASAWSLLTYACMYAYIHPLPNQPPHYHHHHHRGGAAGKTHACQVLQGLGAQVLNGDLLAHQCYLPGQPAHAAIRQAFGSGVFAPDGTVDRRRLGQVVFEAPEQVGGLRFFHVRADRFVD